MQINNKALKLEFLFLLCLLASALAVTAQEKMVYDITLNYKKSSDLSLVDIQTTKGFAPDYKLQHKDGYKLDVISSDKKSLMSMKFNVPVGAVLLRGLTNARAEGSREDLNFTISVPYFRNAERINIYDNKNNKILEIETPSALNLNWIYGALAIILILGLLAYVEFKRKKDQKELMKRYK